jgi:hypothetical protein
MNLNLSSSGGSGNYIRYSPQVNAWTRKDEDGNYIEFKFTQAVFDYENVQTGWMLIATGQYEFLADNTLGKKGAQPSPEHKRGFRATFYNKELGGVVEYSANGAGANMGLEALWKKVQAQAQDNAGKLPVVEFKGATAMKVGKGTTRVPEFDVVKWVARPAAMQDGGADESEFVEQPKPVAKPAPSKPAPSSMNDDEMFS